MTDDEAGTTPLLTAGQVAERLGVDVKTIGAWARSGRLPATATTLGGHRRWSEEAVRAAEALVFGWER